MDDGGGCENNGCCVAFGAGLAIDFDALFLRADDPVFGYASFGVDVGFDAIYFEGGNGDFYDEGGGVGVVKAVGVFGCGDDGEVGLRLGVHESHGAFLAQYPSGIDLGGKNAAKTFDGELMQRRFGHFVDEDSFEEFSAQPFAEAVKILDREPCGLSADSWNFEQCSHAPDGATDSRAMPTGKCGACSALMCVGRWGISART